MLNLIFECENIICCRVCIDHITCMHNLNWTLWSICFDKRTVTSTQTLLLRSALTLTHLSLTQLNTCFSFWSGSPTARPLSHSGYGGLEVPYHIPRDCTFWEAALYSKWICGSSNQIVKTGVWQFSSRSTRKKTGLSRMAKFHYWIVVCASTPCCVHIEEYWGISPKDH